MCIREPKTRETEKERQKTKRNNGSHQEKGRKRVNFGKRQKESTVHCKTHKVVNTVLVNICDEELLGKTVKGNGVDMHISRDYFGNERVSEQEAINMIKESSIVNLAGSRIVEKVVKAQLASKLAVKNVGSVSFLMIYKFTNSRIEQGI